MLNALMLATVFLGSAPIYGMAKAVDGDTLAIGSTRVRLFGIDAPEFDQICSRSTGRWACGQEAFGYLSRKVDGRQIRCDVVGTDQYGRALGKCYLAEQEINRALVSAGMAVAFRRYSFDYVEAEEAAKATERGLWSGDFQMPSEARAHARAASRPTSGQLPSVSPQTQKRSPRGGCVIKGNHSRRGEWIYHLPGMPYYEQTRPEAIFCTEAEAQAAGYRRAIVR